MIYYLVKVAFPWGTCYYGKSSELVGYEKNTPTGSYMKKLITEHRLEMYGFKTYSGAQNCYKYGACNNAEIVELFI